MATNASDRVEHYLSIDQSQREHLGRIRHWNNLTLATEDNLIWIKGLDYAQISSVEIRSLLDKKIYYEKNGRLYSMGSVLPDRITPSLLWSPIDRGIPVALPSRNHNYFGVDQRIPIRLIPMEEERPTTAALVSLESLRYVESAPGIRLAQIRWAVLNSDRAFLMGSPQLPLPGYTYWQHQDMLIPAGYDFEHSVLRNLLQRTICPGRTHWILWNIDNTYTLISKEDLQPLSRSSFRLTLTNH